MKKILILIALVISFNIINKDDEIIIIPKESIRFRVIANSNTIDDQIIKNNISLKLSEYITNIVIDANSKADAMNRIKENKENIIEYIDEYLLSNNISQTYDLSIGNNYFPEKEYNDVKYMEGHYESIVLKLGNSQGLNWWCVMYPPLCLIDETKDSVEYTSIVGEIIKNYSNI